MTRIDELAGRLRASFRVEHLEIEDESALHAGHPGARGGGGHYRVLLVSPDFAGLARLERQRAVYAAVGDMIPAQVHALSTRTYTPEEWKDRA